MRLGKKRGKWTYRGTGVDRLSRVTTDGGSRAETDEEVEVGVHAIQLPGGLDLGSPDLDPILVVGVDKHGVLL